MQENVYKLLSITLLSCVVHVVVVTFILKKKFKSQKRNDNSWQQIPRH